MKSHRRALSSSLTLLALMTYMGFTGPDLCQVIAFATTFRRKAQNPGVVVVPKFMSLMIRMFQPFHPGTRSSLLSFVACGTIFSFIPLPFVKVVPSFFLRDTGDERKSSPRMFSGHNSLPRTLTGTRIGGNGSHQPPGAP